jgi:uncharacterized protein (DUF2147 family)
MRIGPDSRSFPFMSRLRASAVLAVFTLVLTIVVAEAAQPTGTWLTQKGDAHIRIGHCGKALCGAVVWLKDAIDPQTGQPPVDDKNPNPSQRHRRILGLRIFAMTPDGRGGWSGGIYNSDDGQTYRGKLILHGPGTLEVRGCVGAICGGEVWRKVGR